MNLFEPILTTKTSLTHAATFLYQYRYKQLAKTYPSPRGASMTRHVLSETARTQQPVLLMRMGKLTVQSTS